MLLSPVQKDQPAVLLTLEGVQDDLNFLKLQNVVNLKKNKKCYTTLLHGYWKLKSLGGEYELMATKSMATETTA